MNHSNLIGTWARRFLVEYLINERNLARNTQTSYRDTLSLLLPFASEATKTPIDRLTIDSLSSSVIRDFLTHLEQDRGCSAATRNQRLAAVHTFAGFVAIHSPEHVSWCTEIRAIPFKRTGTAAIGYLEREEIEALLAVPDKRTTQGRRDYGLLLTLYNTGARASEMAGLVIADLMLRGSPAVRIVGKGNKERYCPLWTATTQILMELTVDRISHEPVFLSRRAEPMTRFGIRSVVKRCAQRAALDMPSLQTKRVSTHTVRHTTAVHLLRAGVDINTIRAWLGHVSLDTTHVYAEIDLEAKAKALAHCDIGDGQLPRQWHAKSLMAFLNSL